MREIDRCIDQARGVEWDLWGTPGRWLLEKFEELCRITSPEQVQPAAGWLIRTFMDDNRGTLFAALIPMVPLLANAARSGNEHVRLAAVSALAYPLLFADDEPFWIGPEGRLLRVGAELGSFADALVLELESSAMTAPRDDAPLQAARCLAAEIAQHRNDRAAEAHLDPPGPDRALLAPVRQRFPRAFADWRSGDEMSLLADRPAPPPPAGPADLAGGVALWWPLSDYLRLHEQMPRLAWRLGLPHQRHQAQAELAMRAGRGRGTELVRANFDSFAAHLLATGADPLAEDTLASFVAATDLRRVAWPPRPGDRCWCNSTYQDDSYRECCGAARPKGGGLWTLLR